MTSDLRRPERTFTIRNLCVEFRVTPRALRFYEDKGLLYPAREGLNRVYNHRDRARGGQPERGGCDRRPQENARRLGGLHS
jgi:hypothetical protein